MLQAPLPKALDDRIKVWFSSIDRSSGQSLTAKDVAKALEMGGITSDKHSAMKLIQSIDLDGSGTIELNEFEVFIREIVARGHLIDDSTVMLPSGQVGLAFHSTPASVSALQEFIRTTSFIHLLQFIRGPTILHVDRRPFHRSCSCRCWYLATLCPIPRGRTFFVT